MKSFYALTLLSLITSVLAQQITTTNGYVSFLRTSPLSLSPFQGGRLRHRANYHECLGPDYNTSIVSEHFSPSPRFLLCVGFRQTIGGAAATTTAASQASTAATTAATSASTTSASTAAAATTTQVQQGPVGQPGTTPLSPGGPTPYTYTTTDANGNPVLATATFTPTFPATTSYTPTGSGTVIQYSAWLSHIGTNTGALNQPAASQAANPASRAGVKIGVLLGVVSIAIVCVM